MRHSLVKLTEEISFQEAYMPSTNRRSIGEMKRLMRSAINAELTEKQRFCVLAYYFDGRKMYDIARDMGVNPSTVTRHIQNAKSRLKRVAKYY